MKIKNKFFTLTIFALCLVALCCGCIGTNDEKTIPPVMLYHNVQCGNECLLICDIANPSNQTKECTFTVYSYSNAVIMYDVFTFNESLNYKTYEYTYKANDPTDIKPAYAELHVKNEGTQRVSIT